MAKRLTTEEFIEKANIVHNNKYDYSQSEYIKSQIKIEIICKIHGMFEQTPTSHLCGAGCPKCHKESRLSNTEEFIKKSIRVHGNKYDYSNTIYELSDKKLKIICKIHGEFEQRPSHHLNGTNCPECNYVRQKINIQDFIEKSNNIHNNKYDYSKSNYIHSRIKIIITCSIHGDFLQQANKHSRGDGCPKCGIIKK